MKVPGCLLCNSSKKCKERIVGENTVDQGTEVRLLRDSSISRLLVLLRHIADSQIGLMCFLSGSCHKDSCCQCL